MPQFCSAFGCVNRSDKAHCKLKNISFHKFPLKETDRLNQWVSNVKREDFTPTEHSYLCSEHFESDNFENIAPINKRRVLKKDAIPSKFIFSKGCGVKRKRTSYQFGSGSTDVETSPVVSTSTACDAETQTNPDLRIENERLKDENCRLIQKLEMYSLNIDFISDSDMKTLTGFNKHQFSGIYKFFHFEENEGEYCGHSMKFKLYVFLVRLRTGISEELLALMFKYSQSSISRTIIMMTDMTYAKIKAIDLWPSRKTIQNFMPFLFQKNFPNCRVIIDTTEFPIQKPSDPKYQQLTFSNYKNRNTIKCLIGIAPSGGISFVSDAWGGSISDKEIFLNSNMLDLFEKGDAILADRGFLIRKEIEARGCQLYTPHFLKDKIQFNILERKNNKKVSRHRVHVERAILRIKCFKYFANTIPILSLPSFNKLICIIAFLTNFGNPLIKC